jgi:hypothetical protein
MMANQIIGNSIKLTACSQASSFTPSTQYHAAALLTANPPLQQHTTPHAVILQSYAPDDGHSFVRNMLS